MEFVNVFQAIIKKINNVFNVSPIVNYVNSKISVWSAKKDLLWPKNLNYVTMLLPVSKTSFHQQKIVDATKVQYKKMVFVDLVNHMNLSIKFMTL